MRKIQQWVESEFLSLSLLRRQIRLRLGILETNHIEGGTNPMQFTSYLQNGQLTIALNGEIDHHRAKSYIEKIAA